MMRTTLLSLLFMLLGFPIFAQKEITGRVLEGQKREPIVAATVTLHPAGSASILTYAMTNDDGTFTLKHAAMPDSVTLTVRSMTIETQSKTVKSSIGKVDFLVHEKTTELKEVIVKAPKIRQTGDTINYLVSSFADATDRSIGDLLKKLPGVQVLSSGQILYQNKAISKFYIEGLDMLKGKYGVATNNLDVSKVATVQVLENHQPIKALKDMEIPEAAAINLRLKESSKGAFFATAQLGAGLPALLLSNEVVGMRFTRKQQNMVVYKNDNTGRDIAQEVVSFYDNIKNQGVDFLSISSAGVPPIKEQHHLFNNAHMISLNDLHVIRKNVTLSANLNFLHDKQTSNHFSQREIFLPSAEKISIVEDSKANLLKRELEGNLVLEGNSETYFLNNKLRAFAKWNNSSNVLLPGSSVQANQFLKLPELNLSNDFEYLIKRDKRQYRMGAFVGYVSQPTSLAVYPSAFSEILSQNQQTDSVVLQDVSFNHFASNAFFSGGVENKLSVWYKATLYSNIYRLQSQLYNDFDKLKPFSADSLRNDFSRKEFGGIASVSFAYNITSKLKPFFTFPVNYVWVERTDKNHALNNPKGYVLLSPSLHFNVPVSSRVNMYTSLNYSNSIGSVQEDYLGYIMTNYRSLNRASTMEIKYRNTSGNMSLSYKNPFTTLFANLYLMYSGNWTNILRDVRYNGIFSSENGISHPNSSTSFSSSFSLGKSIDAIRTDLRFSSGYYLSNGLTLNQGNIAVYRSQSLSFSSSVTTDVTKWMIVKYGAVYRNNFHRIDAAAMPRITVFRQDISASLIPIKKLILNLTFNHYYNSSLSAEAKSVWFGNAGVKYKMKNADILLDWTNIFNTSRFVNSSYTNTSSYYSVHNLRPMEVLVRVRFKLL